MLPDDAFALGMANAFDHRSVVPGVRKDDDTGDLRTERSEGGPVGHVAGREEQRRFLAVQVGEFALEQDMVVVGAGNVAGAAGTGATLVDGELHRLGHLRMLAHAEIVVGTPDGDFLFAGGRMARRTREISLVALQIGKDAIAPFLMQAIQLGFEERLEIHYSLRTGYPAKHRWEIPFGPTRHAFGSQCSKLRQIGAEL